VMGGEDSGIKDSTTRVFLEVAHFKPERIRKASQTLQTLAPQARCISAGMSGDYEIAIRHGATHVRIGTSITGKRQTAV